jgi:heme exporter protein CcmB
MAKLIIIFFHQLKLYFVKSKIIIANSLFFISFAVIFMMILSPILTSVYQSAEINLSFQQKHQSLLICSCIFALICCMLISASEFFLSDYHDGTIEQMMICCENLEIFIFAKMFANWFCNCFLIIILAMIFLLLFNIEWSIIIKFFWLMIFSSLLINFICLFSSSISMLDSASPIIAVIAIPLILPVIIYANLGIINNFQQNLKILIGLNIFLIPILTYLSSMITKIAVE